ncbi:RNA polymerase III Rpc4 [Ophiocordyceps camponoti-floridani]|uniref:RNA polymerase III Rpc4 n=1 Tax=Ophiocordyceps camponoti-floridani TaxID=2030778 RepID=A0A8H4Q4P1_9HYPO|nr:RNA polymerase III Rpc4 [Ophiocordyceps camponoti-floridani]
MGSRGRGISTASGPFSGGFHGASSSSGSFRTGSSSNAGPFTAGSRANPDTKFSTSQASRRETRINADKLHAMTPTDELDSDDEAMRAALSALPSSSALPMGIYRREHKDAGVVVATTAELEAAEQATGDVPADESSLWVDGDGRTGLAQKPESGNWHPKVKNVRIKKEDDDDTTMLDDASAGHKSERHDEPDVKAKKTRKESAMDLEERNLREDMALLAAELGNTTMSTETPNKDGRLYLFHPPSSPPLTPLPPKPKVKFQDEVDANANTNDQEDSQPPPPPQKPFDAKSLPQGGLIGEMRVHRSGRTEIDWGVNGQPKLEMSPGAPVSFVTTAVIVEESDVAVAQLQAGVEGGYSFAMGPVMGRFVVAPVWEDEDDWEVELGDWGAFC